MPARKKNTTESHAHRVVGDDETETTCECGRTFDDDAAWRRHYERETTAAERKRVEGRAEDGD